MTRTPRTSNARCRIMLSFGFLALGPTACAPDTPEADRSPDPAARQAAVEAMMEADREFARQVAANGVDAWVSFFVEDGVQVISGGELRGHAAIREANTAAFADSTFSLVWEPSWGRVSAGGDFGFTVGPYTSRIFVDGTQVERTGSYISIWEKDETGAWKVLLDGGVPDQQ